MINRCVVNSFFLIFHLLAEIVENFSKLSLRLLKKTLYCENMKPVFALSFENWFSEMLFIFWKLIYKNALLNSIFKKWHVRFVSKK